MLNYQRYILSYMSIYTYGIIVYYMDLYMDSMDCTDIIYICGFIHGLDMDLYMDYTWFVYGLQAMVSIGVHMLCASHGMIELFFS